MKWLIALGALLAALATMFGGRMRWKGRALDASQAAERAQQEVVRLEADIQKERAFAELEKTRALSGPERLHLALLRARLRRANNGGG